MCDVSAYNTHPDLKPKFAEKNAYYMRKITVHTIFWLFDTDTRFFCVFIIGFSCENMVLSFKYYPSEILLFLCKHRTLAAYMYTFK